MFGFLRYQNVRRRLTVNGIAKRANMFAVAGLALLGTFGSRADAYTVRATGRWLCHRALIGDDVPLKFARVEMWDSDCLGSHVCDDRFAVGYTNADGSFSLEGDHDDGGNYYWSKPDPYIQVVLTDDQVPFWPAGVRVIDELCREKSANTPEHDNDNIEGDVSFGTWIWGADKAPGKPTECELWLADFSRPS